MQAKYPAADLSRYFAFLTQALGSNHKHHIAPRAEFPELAKVTENIISLSYQEHFYAHYLLALAVPECIHFQTTFYHMSNLYAAKIKTDELPCFAEVYERGMTAQKEFAVKNGSKVFKALHADPAYSKAHAERAKQRLTILNSDPVFKERSRQRGIKHMIILQSDPAFHRAAEIRLKALHMNPAFAAEHAQRSKKRMTKLHADPLFEKANYDRLKKLNADENFNAKRLNALKLKHANPDFKNAHSDRLKKRNTDPAFVILRNACTAKNNHIRWHVKRQIISPKCALCLSQIS